MFLLAAPAAWTWVANISTSLLVVWGLTPENNSYEDLGIVCIALVFSYLLFQAGKQGCRLYMALKNRAEV